MKLEALLTAETERCTGIVVVVIEDGVLLVKRYLDLGTEEGSSNDETGVESDPHIFWRNAAKVWGR